MTMMTNTDVCSTCGHKPPTPVRYAFSRSMVTGLARLHGASGGPATRKDLGLTGVEYSVFHKMTYWGLIEKAPGERWVLTDLGRSFAEGWATIPEVVYAVNGVTVSVGDTKIWAWDVR